MHNTIMHKWVLPPSRRDFSPVRTHLGGTSALRSPSVILPITWENIKPRSLRSAEGGGQPPWPPPSQIRAYITFKTTLYPLGVERTRNISLPLLVQSREGAKIKASVAIRWRRTDPKGDWSPLPGGRNS